MELTIRDWMVIIGAGLILAVLVDAGRRVLKERRAEVRLNAKISRARDDEEDDDFNLLSELPSGGARIVQREDLAPGFASDSAITSPGQESDDDGPSELEDDSFAESQTLSSQPTGDDVFRQATPNGTNPDSSVDDAFDTAVHFSGESMDAPSFSALDDDDLLDQPQPPAAENPSATVNESDDERATPDAALATLETLDWLDQLDVPEPEVEPEAKLPRGIDPHVFVLHVVSRSEQGFSGADILHILLACDLRFGDMDFFHRHEHQAGRGPIQFSVANMMKPGVFDIDQMSSMYTRGLMFFVTLPGPEDMLKAFDYMYETAKTVSRNLGGDLLDETRSAVTRQGIDHMRQQIRELERRVAEQRNR